MSFKESEIFDLPAGRHAVGYHGLALLVRFNPDSGRYSRMWTQRVRVNGRPTNAGIGSAKKGHAARSESKGASERDGARQGPVPPHAPRAMDASTVRLFSDAVDGYIAMKRASREWTGGRTEEQFRRNVMDHGRALLNQRIDAIEPPAVYSVLMRLMDAPATLHMVKASIASVFRWAKALGYCDRNPCDGLDDALPKKPKAQGREAMEWQAVPGALAKLREAMPDDYRVDALELLILTGTRTREMAQAQIDEFDLDNAVWNIDGPRIKEAAPTISSRCVTMRWCWYAAS